MKEITKNKENFMTVKEVANILGVSIELVTKRIRELFPNKMKHGITTYLNEIEVTAIKLRISENSSLATSYDRTKLVNMPKNMLEKREFYDQITNLGNAISVKDKP